MNTETFETLREMLKLNASDRLTIVPDDYWIDEWLVAQRGEQYEIRVLITNQPISPPFFERGARYATDKHNNILSAIPDWRIEQMRGIILKTKRIEAAQAAVKLAEDAHEQAEAIAGAARRKLNAALAELERVSQ